jgi:hypothetical protein
VDTTASEEITKRICGIPSMIMRNLAVDMMGNMRLRDTVSGESSNPSHERAEFTEEITVHGGEGTTRESEFSRAVMREEGIGMLKESDQHEPVVDPEKKREFEDVGN